MEKPEKHEDCKKLKNLLVFTPIFIVQGKVGLVAGWGKTDNSFGKTGTNILHKVLVPIVKNEECIKWHEDKNIIVQVSSPFYNTLYHTSDPNRNNI